MSLKMYISVTKENRYSFMMISLLNETFMTILDVICACCLLSGRVGLVLV